MSIPSRRRPNPRDPPCALETTSPDTPAQDGDNIFFCNESDDTCPKDGLDPVHNFMSYGDDFPLDRFTTGQNKRQIATWLGQRAKR